MRSEDRIMFAFLAVMALLALSVFVGLVDLIFFGRG